MPPCSSSFCSMSAKACVLSLLLCVWGGLWPLRLQSRPPGKRGVDGLRDVGGWPQGAFVRQFHRESDI